jgi:hypothetical protein
MTRVREAGPRGCNTAQRPERRAAGSRGHIREDAWFGRPSRDSALTTQEPGYLAQMYRKAPHGPPVTSTRMRAEGRGV